MPTPKFLTLKEVQSIHSDQIASFGGSQGIRDQGLLESALAQPKAAFDGQLLHPTIHEQAAAYLYHLAKNHPFLDGNKRTAFAVMETFLLLNGHELTLPDEQTYQMVLDVAQSKLDKEALANLLEQSIAAK